MSVIVESATEDRFEHTQGSDWFIDTEGRLHVRDAKGKHIAAYNGNGWVSARVS